MTSALLLIAIGLDWLLGEPRMLHPLVGFGRGAQRIEAWLRRDDSSAAWARFRGIVAVMLLTMPPTVMCCWLVYRSHIGVPASVAVLYFAIGHRSLHDHAGRVSRALRSAQMDTARREVSRMVSRDTHTMQSSDIARATIESVLENGNDAVFAALFWFAVAGAPGALLYRLANTLDAMWGYRTPRYRYFGWAAARFDDVLNFVPARLTALTYAVMGNMTGALRCWRNQGARWKSPNAGPVMAAGAGGLQVVLGGAAVYHGHLQMRPTLGEGHPPACEDIERALRLVARSVGLWAALMVLGSYVIGALEHA